MDNSMTQLHTVTCHMGSHSVTCHPTQVNTPRLNHSQTGWYSIYLPLRDGRLSWPRWLVTYRDGLPARRRSPIQVLIGPSVD